MKDIKAFIERVGFPVIVRPSYVISGSSMKIANNMRELSGYIESATSISPQYPIIISSFIREGIEAELDCAADGGNAIGVALCHVEEAGVHSGDATIATPYLDAKPVSGMKEIALRLVSELSIKGPFNIQFIIKDGKPLVIELNVRASRSMPFASKSVGINLMDYAVKGCMGKYSWNGFREPKHHSFAVKSPQFSWGALRGSYPHLGPEMRSTGESAAFGRTFESALLKSWLGAQPNRLPKSTVLIYGDVDRSILKETADILSKGIKVSTLDFAPMHGHYTIDSDKALDLMSNKSIDLVITSNGMEGQDYTIRKRAVDMNIPLVLNARLARALAKSFFIKDIDCEEMKAYWKKD